MDYRKEFEEKTGKKYWFNPVCHGDLACCSDEYMEYLESRLENSEQSREAERFEFYKQAWCDCLEIRITEICIATKVKILQAFNLYLSQRKGEKCQN